MAYKTATGKLWSAAFDGVREHSKIQLSSFSTTTSGSGSGRSVSASAIKQGKKNPVGGNAKQATQRKKAPK